jgi:hypothetical protein
MQIDTLVILHENPILTHMGITSNSFESHWRTNRQIPSLLYTVTSDPDAAPASYRYWSSHGQHLTFHVLRLHVCSAHQHGSLLVQNFYTTSSTEE